MSDVPPSLFQRWGHSFEEDSGDVQVYRPASYPFPPARGRAGLEFREDGTFVDWRIGRGDAPTGVEGRWQDEAPNRLLVTSPTAAPFALEIVEANGEVLKVRRRSR